jgi:glycosyltransferase involved in cell wall biosynthesis
MKTILILSYSPLDRDPRVRRQILALKNDYKIVAAGQTPPNISGVDFVSLNTKHDYRRLLLRIGSAVIGKSVRKLAASGHLEKAYWSPKHESIYQTVKRDHYDGIIANDVNMLPISIRIAKEKKIKVYFDAHEYPTRQNKKRNQDYKPLIYEWALKKYIQQPAIFTTVCEGLAKEYGAEFGRQPDIILNAPLLESLSPSKIDSGKIHLVHHGIAAPKRKIETLIELMPKLDSRFHLNLYLVDYNKSYLSHLKKLSKGSKKVTFHDPVKTELISKEINKHDIGIYMLNDDSFNMKYALPNKFFEFIQARLAIVIWPSPEMSKIIEAHKLGWVTKDRDIQAMASLLNNLNQQEISDAKSNSHDASKEFSSESSFSQIQNIARMITNDS